MLLQKIVNKSRQQAKLLFIAVSYLLGVGLLGVNFEPMLPISPAELEIRHTTYRLGLQIVIMPGSHFMSKVTVTSFDNILCYYGEHGNTGIIANVPPLATKFEVNVAEVKMKLNVIFCYLDEDGLAEPFG